MTNEQFAAILNFIGSQLATEIDALAKLLPDDMPKEQVGQIQKTHPICLDGLLAFRHELRRMFNEVRNKR